MKLPTLELVFSTYKIDSHVHNKLQDRLSEGLGRELRITSIASSALTALTVL
jgi:hypothetical protein